MLVAELDQCDCAADGVRQQRMQRRLTLVMPAVIQGVKHLQPVLALLRFLLHLGESFLRTKAVHRLAHDGGRGKGRGGAWES